jgi:hypothetical protein
MTNRPARIGPHMVARYDSKPTGRPTYYGRAQPERLRLGARRCLLRFRGMKRHFDRQARLPDWYRWRCSEIARQHRFSGSESDAALADGADFIGRDAFGHGR